MLSRFVLPALVAAFTVVSAVPTKNYAEVIPGPGLPSLASLGLTTAELYEITVSKEIEVRSTLQARYTPSCGPSEAAYTNVNEAIACYNYLKNLGTQPCTVRGPPGTRMCSSGNTRVLGVALSGGSASSYCRDVASAVLWVINSCTRNDRGDTAGSQAAGGNGNLVVQVTNVRYADAP